jgi:sulfite exporter TauE/SafE/copper chaperone CopZ
MIAKLEVEIVGMHCKACEKIIAENLSELDGVKDVKVSLKKARAVILSEDELDINNVIKAISRAGYRVGHDNRPLISRNSKDWKIAAAGVIIATVSLFIFAKLGLNPSGFLDSNENNVAVVGLVMGLTAGFSTCMALIGGLVAVISARYEKLHAGNTRWQNFAPHIAFNIGRIAGFSILGGLIGWVGSALTFSPLALGLLTFLAGLFMLVLGLQLTGLFPRLTSLSLPPKLAEKLGIAKHSQSGYHTVRTAMIGSLTFFLPCGFTQAMQLFAVSTGSWQLGALAMGLFALGTTPGLILIGGLASLIKGEKAKTIFKIVGVLVTALALVSVAGGLKMAGLQLTDFSSKTTTASQRIELVYLGFADGFDKKVAHVEAGRKYTLSILAKENGVGCMSTVMLPGLSDTAAQLLIKGKVLSIEFEAKKAGEYELVCAMGVPFDSKIIVEEK